MSFYFAKELPIPLDELWFDYLTTPLKQGFRLDITVIRQESAKAELAKYLPLKLTVLDLLNHSILRAFYVILGQEPINTLFLYQDQQGCLAVCERLQQRQVLQSQHDLSELYQQFIQRFPEKIEQVYVYQTPDILNSRTIESLPQNWQRIETDLPVIALGNALWQTDLKLVDLSSKHLHFCLQLIGRVVMLSLNLLPWRLEQHQKAVRRFMWQGLIWIACSVLIFVGLSHLNEQQVYALNQTKEKLAQITNQVHKKRIQVQQLQSNLKEMNELTEMDTEYVYRMLNLLSELPLQQGELDVFTLNAKQVALSGMTENQQEFEAIHQFLKHHFTEVNLTKFQPVQQQLFFQFDIQLLESEQ